MQQLTLSTQRSLMCQRRRQRSAGARAHAPHLPPLLLSLAVVAAAGAGVAAAARLPAGAAHRGGGAVLKKDVFASRGWGAGGMPFSVLYLNPQQQQQQGAEFAAPPPLALPAPPPRALAQREPVLAPPVAAARVMGGGGAGGGVAFDEAPLRSPARRHYSIIPQLFVSYGWGPLGK